MNDDAGTKAVPDGMHAVTPHLVCADANAALDWYCKAFGATEKARMPGPGGKLMHGAFAIDGSMVMLADEWPEHGSFGPKSLKGSPVVLHLYVPDVDASVAKAVAAGATVTMPVADMFWGDRYGQIEDPYGHRWSIATHTRDVSPDEMQQAMRQMAGGSAP